MDSWLRCHHQKRCGSKKKNLRNRRLYTKYEQKKIDFYPIAVSHLAKPPSALLLQVLRRITMSGPAAAADVHVTTLRRYLLKRRWFPRDNNIILYFPITVYVPCSGRVGLICKQTAPRLTQIRRRSFITLSPIGHHL